MLFIAPCLLDEKQYIKLLDRVIERERDQTKKVPPTHTLTKYIAFYKMYKGEFILRSTLVFPRYRGSRVGI